MSASRDTFLFAWWHRAGRPAKYALIAASLGWMLDAFDVMAYALVQKAVMEDLHASATTAGTLQSITLLAAAAGGLVFGLLADRWGRVRALALSILLYSIFTALCGFAASVGQLAVFRALLGFGMGGEWASGAALVSETWSDRDRGKALGFMQSSWAIGYGLAAVANLLVRDVFGFNWRALFFVGALPALLVFWIQSRVAEPELWRERKTENRHGFLRDAFGGKMLKVTLAVTLMNACCLFAWWGFNNWAPTFLSSAPEKGGIGLSNGTMSIFVVVMQIGMWLGYVTFGFLSDALGRKRVYVGYLFLAAALICLYGMTRNPWMLCGLGPVAAFFATGYYSGFGAVTAELYPTHIRASAQGFTYNLGRIASAFAPPLVGGLAAMHGYPAAFSVTAAAFVLAAICWFFIPETRGRSVKPDSI